MCGLRLREPTRKVTEGNSRKRTHGRDTWKCETASCQCSAVSFYFRSVSTILATGPPISC
jgi:hypothetical protein